MPYPFTDVLDFNEVSEVPAMRNFRLQMSSNITKDEFRILLRKPSISVNRGPNSSCPTCQMDPKGTIDSSHIWWLQPIPQVTTIKFTILNLDNLRVENKNG